LTSKAGFGLDSFSLVELLLFCERTFGVVVPESQLTHENLESIAALSRCLRALPAPAPLESQPE
jgi:acyl carrier protein